MKAQLENEVQDKQQKLEAILSRQTVMERDLKEIQQNYQEEK